MTKKEIIAVQFYLNEEDEITSGHDYKIVDLLDEENFVVEVLAEKDKWNDIRVEAKDLNGNWKNIRNRKDGVVQRRKRNKVCCINLESSKLIKSFRWRLAG